MSWAQLLKRVFAIDITTCPHCGGPLTLIAAEKDNLLAAQLLLELDAKVNPKDNSGKTPFDYAESREMVVLLKEHGAVD